MYFLIYIILIALFWQLTVGGLPSSCHTSADMALVIREQTG